ncbi:MAG: radical SAM protein [Nitrospirota bacterium]|nr:radical SAM protein [Nitrospirota bacterium]
MAKIIFLQKHPFPQLGLMDIAAVLKENGHQCELLIESEERNVTGLLCRNKPDVVAFSCTTGEHKWVLKRAKEIKRRLDVPIILGGAHPTFYPEVIEDENIDIVCRGEGEFALLELMNSLDEKRDYTNIKNLWVKKSDKIYENELRPLVENLDSLPLPDRDIYYKYSYLRNGNIKSFMTGRGCPYNCSFCFNFALREMYKGKGAYIRKKSVDRVIKEIETVSAKYGLKVVMFSDDTLILSREWLYEFLKEYRKKIALPFFCIARANLVDEEIIFRLKNAGCYYVSLGIETGNDYLRNKVLKKETSNEEIKRACYLIKKYGLKLKTYNILGIPGETLQTAFETLNLNIAVKSDFAWCSIFQPYPKTPLAEYCTEQGFLDKNFSPDTIDWSYFKNSVLKLNNIKEIINLQKFFSLSAKYPFFLPLIKLLIKLPRNPLFHFFFKLNYAIDQIHWRKQSFGDIVKLGIKAVRRF